MVHSPTVMVFHVLFWRRDGPGAEIRLFMHVLEAFLSLPSMEETGSRGGWEIENSEMEAIEPVRGIQEHHDLLIAGILVNWGDAHSGLDH